MEIRNIISKFIANLFEKNYAEANKNLQTIVESKIKTRVASIMEASESQSKARENFKKMIASKKGKSKKSSDKKDGKKLSDKQKDIAKKAPPYDKITGDDFKALRNKKNSKKGKK